jgi:type I restriction enzyme M protein
MEKFGHRYGIGMAETLSALLDYIIGFVDPFGKPVEGWRYNKEQNQCFYTMMTVYFNIMQDALVHDGWHDAFGDLFMEWAGSKNALGQCFTPACICDMMADCTFGDTKPDVPQVNCNGFGRRITVSDCACGSGRLLLAAASKLERMGAEKPYLIGEDIDAMCCKQTAINMMVHGCFGEVICHDTLCEPGEARFGYIVNEGLYPFPGLPTIRRFTDSNMFIGCRIWKARKQAQESPKIEEAVIVERAKVTAPAAKPKAAPIQLSLFGDDY